MHLSQRATGSSVALPQAYTFFPFLIHAQEGRPTAFLGYWYFALLQKCNAHGVHSHQQATLRRTVSLLLS